MRLLPRLTIIWVSLVIGSNAVAWPVRTVDASEHGLEGLFLPKVNIPEELANYYQDDWPDCAWVWFRFTVTETGEVTDLEVVKSWPTPALEGHAMEIVRRGLIYEPKKINGSLVAVSGVYNKITFRRYPDKGCRPGG